MAVNFSRKLRIAFVGGAYDSAVGRAHLGALALDQQYDLVAGFFSRNALRNDFSAGRYGVAPEMVFSDLDSLLSARSHFDAVIVLTPQTAHLEPVLACLRNGIPVICEKALVSRSEEALQVKDAIRESNGFLAVTYNYTGYPMVRELRRLVEIGFFGELLQLHLEMPQEGFLRRDSSGKAIAPQEWRLRDGFVPTVSLDLGIHVHMFVGFVAQCSPIEVVSTSNTFGSFKQIVDTVSCLVRYSNGMEGSILYGKTSLGYRNGLRIRLFGSKHSAEWLQSDPENLSVADEKGNRIVLDRASPITSVANESRYQRFKVGHPAGFIEAFANYYHDVYLALQSSMNQTPAPNSGYVLGVQESLEGLRFLEAVALSSQSGCWESVVL